MAAYFITKDGKEHIVHVGENMTIPADNIVEVQVDGDELSHVESKFSNLPKSTGRVVKYYGDHAKFIVGNW